MLEQIGKCAILTAFVLAIGLMIFELTCYIVIYLQVYMNDEKIKAAISKKTVSYRRRRNIISLSTQVLNLGIEIVGSIIGALIVSFHVTDASLFPIIACIGSAMISFLHVFGSAEMRDFYFRME